MKRKMQTIGRMPKMLPTAHQEEGMYFIDLHLRNFRLHGTCNSVPFDSVRGREICDQFSILTCPACRLSAIVSGAVRQDELLRCMRCMSLLSVR